MAKLPSSTVQAYFINDLDQERDYLDEATTLKGAKGSIRFEEMAEVAMRCRLEKHACWQCHIHQINARASAFPFCMEYVLSK